MPGYDDAIKAELLRLEEDVLYTEKAHFATANLYSQVHLWIGILATVAAAVAAATVVGQALPVVAASAALVAALASTINTFLKPHDAELNHLTAGRRLGALRIRIRQAVALDLDPDRGLSFVERRELVKTLAAEKETIDGDSPGTSNRAFRSARRKIEAGHFAHSA